MPRPSSNARGTLAAPALLPGASAGQLPTATADWFPKTAGRLKVDRAAPEAGSAAAPPAAEWKKELSALLQASHQELLAKLEQRLEAASANIIKRLDSHGDALEVHHDSLTSRLHEKLDAVEGVIEKTLASGLAKGTARRKFPKNAMHSSDSSGSLQMKQRNTMDLQMQCAAEETAKSRRTSIRRSKKSDPPIKRFVESHWFETFGALAIFFNAIFIGVQTDIAATSPEHEDHVVLYTLDLMFTLVFTVELALKVMSAGFRFIKQDLLWNIMDVFIVFTSLLEVAFDLAARWGSESVQDPSTGSASQFRILRILRVTRFIRGIRVLRIVRFIRALRTLVHQLVSAIKSMIWALILLVMIIYLFALGFTQATTSQLQYHADSTALTAETRRSLDALQRSWSTVPRSMFTLFQSITGGVSWAEVVHPLSDLNFVWVILFVTYICFAQMVVLNVLTGVFCQNAIDSAAHDQRLVTQAVLQEKQRYIDQLSAIFSTIDDDGSGAISISEFKNHMENNEMKAYFESLGLDATDVWILFRLLDMDEGSVIEFDEFVSGCLRLKGNAKGVDMAKLIYEHQWLDKRLTKFMEHTEQRLRGLCGEVEELESCSASQSVGMEGG